MTSRLSTLLLLGAAFLIASASQAQVIRPSESIYILLRGGVLRLLEDAVQLAHLESECE